MAKPDAVSVRVQVEGSPVPPAAPAAPTGPAPEAVPTVGTPAAPGGASPTPFGVTGASVGLMVALALVLVLLGAAIVAAARTRLENSHA